MSSNTITIMAGAVVLAVLILLGINLIPFFSTSQKKVLISLNDTNGMAVVHNGTPYTLNFEQQNSAMEYINRAVFVKKSDYANRKKNFEVEKITVYRFKKPEVDIFPIDLADKNLIFSAPAWSQEYYFMDLSAGGFQRLLISSFDP